MSLNRCERGATRCLYGTIYYSTWESTCHYLHDSFKDVLISTWQYPCRQAAHWWSRGAVLRHASLAAPQSEGKKKKQVIITVDFKGRLFTIGNCAQHSLTTQTSMYASTTANSKNIDLGHIEGTDRNRHFGAPLSNLVLATRPKPSTMHRNGNDMVMPIFHHTSGPSRLVVLD